MGKMTRAKYRRWRRAEEDARRHRQGWRVVVLCLLVFAGVGAYLFYDRVYLPPPEEPVPPDPIPRPVTLVPPKAPPAEEVPPPSGETRPELPETRAESRRVRVPRQFSYEESAVPRVDSPPQPTPKPVSTKALPPPPPPPVVAPPPPRPVTRVSQERVVPRPDTKSKKRVVKKSPKKKRAARPGPPGSTTLHEVTATPIDD